MQGVLNCWMTKQEDWTILNSENKRNHKNKIKTEEKCFNMNLNVENEINSYQSDQREPEDAEPKR